jgi:hypothetical protein
MGTWPAACLIAVACATAADDPYHWPLDLPRALTSSFGEYRGSRFHAGIDLRTGGIGKDVHAAGDGYISRLRCSPYGYGKAVYLKFPDGKSVVYGHLDAFAEPMAEFIRKTQHERKSYTLDLQIEPNQFPIKKGQLIAKSGQTGIGAPHLHYEFRDASEQPINPRLLGITWQDEIRPVIRKVVIVPASSGASVDGDIIPAVFAAKPDGKGNYVCDAVRASGLIGFGVDVIDPANNGESILGVRVLRVLLDGNEKFRMQHDLLSYDNMNNEAVSYYPFLRDKGRFSLAWRWPGNRCASYNVVKETGWLEVPDGESTVVIETEDFVGNRSSVTVPIRKSALSAKDPGTPKERGRGKVSSEYYGESIVLTANFNAPEPSAPQLETKPVGASVPFQRIDSNTFRASVPLEQCTHSTELMVSHERMDTYTENFDVYHRTSAGVTEIDGCTVRVNDGSAYGALPVRVTKNGPHEGAAGLKPAGDAYTIWPSDAPIDAEVEIAIPISESARDDSHIGLYRISGNGWPRESAEKSGGKLVIKTRRFGTFQAMSDVTPPTLRIISPDPSKPTTSRRPEIQAEIDDNASGIAGITATCGDQWLLMEYDPERERVTWMRDEDLPAGKQTVKIVVTDNAGSSSVKNVSLSLPN